MPSVVRPTENATQQRLMEARARALATVLLTRREGTLVRDVSDASAGSGIDICATLVSEKKPGLRQLGVQLRWQFEPVTAEQGNDTLRADGGWQKLIGSGPFRFPVLVFFFTMRDDSAWYSWVAEPVVEDGKAKLPLRPEPDCQRLTDDSLEELLDHVDAWYDAHYRGLTAAVSGGKRPNAS